jgi:hypothetical protein
MWAHRTSVTPPLFIEVPVQNQESKLSCISVLGVSILHLSQSEGFELTTFVVIDTYCASSCKSQQTGIELIMDVMLGTHCLNRCEVILLCDHIYQ